MKNKKESPEYKVQTIKYSTEKEMKKEKKDQFKKRKKETKRLQFKYT